MKKIVLTGGGTAGHVTPNLALISSLTKDNWEIHYIGTKNGIERTLIAPIESVQYHAVESGKLRRYFDLKNVTDAFRVVAGVAQASAVLRRLKPDLVFSKGGFVSVPVVYAAGLRKIPVLLHESDMTPGLANKLCAPIADKLLCTFPEAAKIAGDKGVTVGTPLRPELLTGDRARGLKQFGFDAGRPVLMVMGGSTGAQSINRALRQALEKLLNSFQILHLCGKGNIEEGLEGTKGYCQREYLNEEMADAYAAADILISRAGSNSLCEILALHKPALLIPYPKSASRGDQIDNANSFHKRGFSEVLMQEEMTPEALASRVVELYKNRGGLIENMEKEPSANGLRNVMEIIREYE